MNNPINSFTYIFYVIFFAAIIFYSITLIAIELRTSQEFVRNFFTDIDGPVPFYAVNTTISVFLLWSTALIFAVCLAATDGVVMRDRLRCFYLSQVLIFGFLGVDDRFKFHEFFAAKLGIHDHFVLLATATFEAVLLIWLGGKQILLSPAAKHLLAAVILFAVMIVFDAVVPKNMTLRLSIEDLAKTWSALFFFLFAWRVLMDCLQQRRKPSV